MKADEATELANAAFKLQLDYIKEAVQHGKNNCPLIKLGDRNVEQAVLGQVLKLGYNTNLYGDRIYWGRISMVDGAR